MFTNQMIFSPKTTEFANNQHILELLLIIIDVMTFTLRQMFSCVWVKYDIFKSLVWVMSKYEKGNYEETMATPQQLIFFSS